MRRTNKVDVESLLVDTGKCLLDKASILANDRGVVSLHFSKVCRTIWQLAIEKVAIKRPK